MASASADYDPGQAAAAGLGWVDKNHPLYGTKGYVGYDAAAAPADPGAPSAAPTGNDYPSLPAGATPPPGYYDPQSGKTAPGGPAAPGTPTPPATPAAPAGPQTSTDPNAPATVASPGLPGTATSTNPVAPPDANTSNQGGQDVYRNTLINQMGQQEVPTVDDASIKAQLDPYRAEQTRAMRDEIRAGAEAGFAGGQDYGAPEQIAAAERAGQNTGLKAADLVGRELTDRRSQIQQALQQFGATMSDDQRRALEAQQADLDRALKAQQFNADLGFRQQGLAQTGQLGNRELDIRDKIGMGGLNLQSIAQLLQNLQFNKDLGYRIGATEQQGNQTSAGAT